MHTLRDYIDTCKNICMNKETQLLSFPGYASVCAGWRVSAGTLIVSAVAAAPPSDYHY